jgi:hypothetical protein
MDDKKQTCHRTDLATGLSIVTGSSYTFELEPPAGILHLFVRDARGYDPVANEKYEVTGPHDVHLSGTTSAQGEIKHEQPPTPIDHYDLAICGQTFKVEARAPELEPSILRVPGWPTHDLPAGPSYEPGPGTEDLRVFIHAALRDDDLGAIANASYVLRGSQTGHECRGTTDGQGVLREDDLPDDHYTLECESVTEPVEAYYTDDDSCGTDPWVLRLRGHPGSGPS